MDRTQDSKKEKGKEDWLECGNDGLGGHRVLHTALPSCSVGKRHRKGIRPFPSPWGVDGYLEAL